MSPLARRDVRQGKTRSKPAMNVKQFVIETLRHTNVNRINFRYGRILVYPLGYSRDVAQLVKDGHILRNQTDAQTAEGAAYLAGWMASLLWGYPRLPSHAVPTTGHAYANWLAGRRLNGQIGYVIPDTEVRVLNALVATGAPSRYVFNGI